MISGKITVKEAVERLVKTTATHDREIKYFHKMIIFLKRVVMLDAFLFGAIAVILIEILTNQ